MNLSIFSRLANFDHLKTEPCTGTSEMEASEVHQLKNMKYDELENATCGIYNRNRIMSERFVLVENNFKSTQIACLKANV